MFPDFSLLQIAFTALLFMWAGFVRSGLGFGGAALGLPFMLFIYDQPVYWLPIIGWHLLFFSGITLRTRLHNVDWAYLKHSLLYIIPPTLVGVFGLISLPTQWIVLFIYSITLFYAFMWLFNKSIHGGSALLDRFLLVLGGYIAGTSLTGAPLMVAVYAKNVAREQLRNTLFVLWFILVSIKMSTFAVLSVDLNPLTAVVLLPVAAIGHFIGLRLHEYILHNDIMFKRVIGGMLVVVSGIGLVRGWV
ncbi:MAG TPA: sulfite exporter TauE/SafE family protein [Gammaproteobacteria bacterium]|nr:sulfite exporter TauE/SafE family protein [Gammaproteobacteria bacterium]